MENELISFLSVLFFCLCCRQFIKAVTTPIPLLRTERVYARGAMQMEKFYKSIAWGTMSGVFLLGLVMSFHQVFVQI